MSDPVSLDILEAMQLRLQAIDPESGFNTTAGERVHLGKKYVNQDQKKQGAVLNIYDSDWTPDETTAHGHEPIITTMAVTVAGFILDTDNEGPKLAHLLIQDIYNAMLDSTNLTLSGLSLDIGFAGVTIEYPEQGGDTITLEVDFTCQFLMPYGNI